MAFIEASIFKVIIMVLLDFLVAASSAFVRTNAILRCKMLVGRFPNPF